MASLVQETQAAEAQTRFPPRRTVFLRFLVCLVALPLFLYLLPFAVIRTQAFIRFAGSEFSPSLDYSFTTAGQNADIVIYGDSSAFYGVSPLQMSNDLGMKVINLPNTGGSLPVIDDLPLRYYLSVNRAPKLIIFYFSPWDLDYSHEDSKFLYEGEEVLLRHGSAKEIAAFALKHPFDALEYPFMAYSTGPKAAIVSALHHTDRFRAIAANRGHLDSASVSAGGRKAVTNIQSPCVIPHSYIGKGSQSVQELRAKYANGSTRTLVFLAPVPTCDNVNAIINRDYSEVGAVRPTTLPTASFRNDGMFIHLDPSAVPATTVALSAAVKQALAKPVN